MKPAPNSIDSPVDARDITRGFLGIWRIITFLLVFLGFLALAFTGEIEPLVMLLFVISWVITILVPRPMAWLNPWAGRSVVALVMLGIAYVGIQLRFESLLYLLMFLGMFKCVNLREPVDHLHAILMAFFMILATSIITSSVSFLLFMLTFIVLATLDLICLTLAREAARSRNAGTERLVQNPLQHLGGSMIFLRLLSTCAFNAVPILALAFCLFFILPHYQNNALSNPLAKQMQGDEATTGYTDEFSLDRINRLALDNTQVMRVQPRWTSFLNRNRPLPRELRMRGMALEYYDEDNWKTQWDSRPMTGQFRSDRIINLPSQSLVMGPEIELSVEQDFNIVHRLFGASIPHQFVIPRQEFSNSLDYIQQAQAVDVNYNSNRSRTNQWVDYKVRTYLAEEATPFLTMLASRLEAMESSRSTPIVRESPMARTGPGFMQVKSALADSPSIRLDPRLVMNESLRRTYTQLPDTELSRRIRRIAETQTRSDNAAGMAIDFNNWFAQDFEYSLSTNAPSNMHPIEAFLTRTRSGHCEYFATAMVLMLRSQGVPARVATGFYTQQFDSDQKQFLVVQSDAHAWAEVFIDGLGWLTLDPTPPEQRGRASLDKYKPPFFKRINEEVRSLWQTYILDYSRNEQTSIHTLFFAVVHKLSNTVLPDSLNFSISLGGAGESSTTPILKLIVLVVAIVVVAILLVLAMRRLRWTRKPRRNLRSPVKFMNQMVSRLQSAGYRRSPSETPQELFERIEPGKRQEWEIDYLLSVYHRMRFGGETIDSGESSRIQSILRSIR